MQGHLKVTFQLANEIAAENEGMLSPEVSCQENKYMA